MRKKENYVEWKRKGLILTYNYFIFTNYTRKNISLKAYIKYALWFMNIENYILLCINCL